MSSKLLYKIPEAAEILSVSDVTIRRLVARGELVVIRKLRHILITRASVEKFAKSGDSGLAAK
jgi:excisionase family DNA binding protein